MKQCRLDHGKSILDCEFNEKRVRTLKEVDGFPQDVNGGVLYWMVRDQRIQGLCRRFFSSASFKLKENFVIH